MTEPDIIRIDGVEYEVRYRPVQVWAMKDYYNVILAKKRLQTGWKCELRGECCGPCYKIGRCPGSNPQKETLCLRTGARVMPKWEPFYGKVVEE